MSFEEFFKKKKINLQTLEQGEPGLFFEFKNHFEQMGEKSFDHTKKYWFNKLRLRFPAPVEAKFEKVVIENQLAEQTITESMVESSAPLPATGFKPRFKAGATKPVEQTSEEKKEEAATGQPAPSIGFKPRFKSGTTKPSDSPAEEKKEELPAEQLTQNEQPAATPVVGFKPKFKAGVTKSAEPFIEPKKEESPAEQSPQNEQSATTPAVGFKLRFKAGVTKAVSPEPGKQEDPPAIAPAESSPEKPE